MSEAVGVAGIIILFLLFVAMVSPDKSRGSSGYVSLETSEPPPPPLHPIKETNLKKGGVAENFIRPKPLLAKPGDIIIVTPLPKETTP